MKSQIIKVSIIDDNKSFRDSLKLILEENPKILIHGEYESGRSFIDSLKSPFQPDVCLIDVILNDMSGLECAKRIKTLKPGIHIVIMTSYPDSASFSEARKLNADYIEKGQRSSDLIKEIIISSVPSNKEKIISLQSESNLKLGHIDFLNKLDTLEKQLSELSNAQLKVLKLRKEGKSIKEIAEILNVEQGTVYTHLRRALKKLDIPNLLDIILE
ncbi:MAG: response regulator transcription factor [Spirochaetota bacterium]|nr:response regulator transcription factor [Spirochaetota bacterium]